VNGAGEARSSCHIRTMGPQDLGSRRSTRRQSRHAAFFLSRYQGALARAQVLSGAGIHHTRLAYVAQIVNRPSVPKSKAWLLDSEQAKTGPLELIRTQGGAPIRCHVTGALKFEIVTSISKS